MTYLLVYKFVFGLPPRGREPRGGGFVRALAAGVERRNTHGWAFSGVYIRVCVPSRVVSRSQSWKDAGLTEWTWVPE